MATIKELKNIDFNNVPDQYKGLADGIKQLIADYDQESDKTFFEKEAQDNINAYYEMVQSVVPGSLPGKKDSPKADQPTKQKHEEQANKEPEDEGSKIQGKNRKLLFDSHNTLLDLSIDYEGEESDDLEGFFENVLTDLNLIIEKGKEEEIPSQVWQAVQPFYAQAEMLEGNQKVRLGSVNDTDIAYRDKAVKVVDRLLNEWKAGRSGKKQKKKQGRQDKPPKKAPEEKQPSPTPEEIAKEKKEKEEKSKRVLKKVEAYEQDIAACRAVIREYNKKKRESAPPRPKPTRRTQLKKKMLSIIRLTPEALVGEPAVQAENRKIVKGAIKAFMKNWGMNSTSKVEKALDKELDEIEEKVEDKENRETAQRWAKELPDTDKIIAFERKHNKHLLKEAADQVQGHLKEAVSLYRKDPDKAFEYLNGHFNKTQLEAYLPNWLWLRQPKSDRSDN